MTSFSDIQNVAISGPAIEIDKIVYSNNYTTSTTDAVNQTNIYTASLGSLGLDVDDYMVIGVAQYHTSAVWNDMGNYTMPSGITIKPTVYVRGYIYGTDLVFDRIQASLINGGSPYSISIKYALIAKPSFSGSVNGDNVNSLEPIYQASLSYMKIATQGSYSAGAGNSSTTIAHNLGYVPFFDAYYKDGSTMARLDNQLDVLKAVADETNLTLYVSMATGGTVYYRVYYEN